MLAVTLICHRNKAFIKPFLICTAFVSTNKQNRLTLWIECKSNAPNIPHSVKSHFLHVGVRSTFKRVYCGAAQIGSELR